MGDNEVEDVDVTAANGVEGVFRVQKVDMSRMIAVEAGAILKETSLIIEDEVRIPLFGDEEEIGIIIMIFRIETEIIGIDRGMVNQIRVRGEDGTVTEAKEIVIGDGDDVGIQIPVIHNRNTPSNHPN